MNLSKEKYQALISDVEKEFGLLLAKSEESEESKDDKGDSHEVKEAITGEVEKEPETKVAQDEEKEAEDKKDEKEAEESKENEEAHGYDEGDMAELHKCYGSMSKSELELHKNILMAHHMAKHGVKADDSSMAKSETATVEVKATVAEAKEETLSKSEADSIKKENEALKKNVQDLLTSLEGFIVAKAPARKAITEIGVLGKSETVSSKQLSKSEITVILDSKTKDPSLSKSDREVINNYYSGKCSVEQIKHLLG